MVIIRNFFQIPEAELSMAKSIVSASASSIDVDGLVVALHGAFGARATVEISSMSALPVLEMAPGGEEEEEAGGFSESAETAFFNTQVKRNVLPHSWVLK